MSVIPKINVTLYYRRNYLPKLISRDAFYPDWHESVIRSADLPALAEKKAPSIREKC